MTRSQFQTSLSEAAGKEMPFQCSGLEPAVCSNQEFMKAGSRVVAGEKNSVSSVGRRQHQKD